VNKSFLIPILILGLGILFYFFRTKLSASSGELQSKIDAGALVVDVRSVAEYNSGHYPGALNIPVDQVSKRISEFGDKNKPVIVYCASGGRSGSAKSYLQSIGFTDVTNAGGLGNMPKK
jgi:phage shock protein E